MPKSKEQYARLRIIDELLRNRSWVKTREMAKVVQDKLDERVDLRTIQKDIKDMANDSKLGYYAPIEYDHKEKAYRYTDKGYSISNFSLQSHEIAALKFYGACLELYSSSGIFKDFSSAIEKIISGISLRQRLKKETDPDLIIQTDTVFDTAGSNWLELFVIAIDEKTNVRFDYGKYNSTEEKQQRIISPYLLKEYRNRWYVIGMSVVENQIKTFALERVSNCHHFGGDYVKDDTFDPESYFKHCFGITALNEPVQHVVLEFSKAQIPYIKSVPIHPTQNILHETQNSLKINIDVVPSYELYEYILGKIPDVKVVSPASVVEHILKQIKAGLKKNS
jgi:predicted DNA-binding transcriptional regulator YafY